MISKDPIFIGSLLPRAHDAEEIVEVMDAFGALLEKPCDPLAAQAALPTRFKTVVDDWIDKRGDVDPAQVVKAYMIAAWRYIQNLSEDKWKAAEPYLADEIAALGKLCDPDGNLLANEQDE